MALIVEDGTGLTTAEAYVSVADADTYHSAYGNPSSWSGASDPDKESALRQATQYLDATYTELYKGLRYSRDQALDWPRYGVVVGRFTLETNEIPTALEQASAILALKIIDGDTLAPDVSEPGAVTREKIKVGPIEEDVTYSGGKSEFKKYSLVERVLGELLESASKVVRA